MKSPNSLLNADEPPAVTPVNPSGSSRTLLVCDHASNRLPLCLGTLGLDSRQIADHIAWDPGAAMVAQQLAAALDAPLILSGYSRLVVDCNRPLHSRESIAQQVAGISIPGNQQLTAEMRAQRINALFHPYHDAITHLLNQRQHKTQRIISIHSFTHWLLGQERPWHIGVSTRRDSHLAELVCHSLSQTRDICVGRDQPYPIDESIDYTLPHHGERRNLESLMIEIRQDGLNQQKDVSAWVNTLSQAIHYAEASLDSA